LGALLGGGIGRLQGMHGLMLDQLLSARVVTASGKIVVASSDSNQDLLWALKGAGHNFGIITEARIKIYDQVSNGQWYSVDMFFEKGKLSSILKLLEDMQPLPKEMSLYLLLAMDPHGSGKVRCLFSLSEL
jgi:FAD/FMN-containing dehydrogenase